MKESVFLRATTALEANSRARNWPASKFTAAELLPEHPVLGALAIDRIDEHRMMLPADFFKAVDATTACGRAFVSLCAIDSSGCVTGANINACCTAAELLFPLCV